METVSIHLRSKWQTQMGEQRMLEEWSNFIGTHGKNLGPLSTIRILHVLSMEHL